MRLDREQIEVMDDRMADILRSKTPKERLRIAVGLWNSACKLLTGVIRMEHPEWSPERIQQEVSHRLAHGSC